MPPKTRFHALFVWASGVSRTPEALVEALSVEVCIHNTPSNLYPVVVTFRHLTQKARLKAAQSFFARTAEGAAARLQAAGLQAKAKTGFGPLLIQGAQGYDPASSPHFIGLFTGIAFQVNVVPSGGFEARWMSGPQQTEERNVATLEEAVTLIIENVPALPGV